jgi:Glycosyltransferase family 87
MAPRAADRHRSSTPKRSRRAFRAASRTSWGTAGGSSAWDSTLRREVALAGALIALALAFTLFRPPQTAGPFGRDFEAYYAAGATWNAGGDPWSRAVWRVERTIPRVDASRDELLPYVGPAAALPLFGALARLPHMAALRVWAGLLAAAYSALILAALALARTRRVAVLLGAMTLGLAAGPVTSDIALGQAALLSAAGIACALLAYERAVIARGALAAAALACGAFATLLAGIQPNLALALVARMRDRVALACAALGALAFAALTLGAGGGIGGFREYLRRLGEHGRAERFDLIQHTPAALAWGLGAPESLAAAVGIACALAALAVTVVVTVRARLGPRDGTLLALAALPFAVPFFHEHDFVVEMLPLCVLAIAARGAPARALAGIAAVLIGVDWLGLAQRPPATVQIVLLGFAVACAFAVVGPGARTARTDLVPFAALLALACVALPLARAHAAPTWPDGLPPGYRAPANADASAVWSDEQRAAGLDARDPAWSALRALPLTGCIVLGAAILLARRELV